VQGPHAQWRPVVFFTLVTLIWYHYGNSWCWGSLLCNHDIHIVSVAASPFRSPLSCTLSAAFRHAHTYFCPDVDCLLSLNMDTTPTSVLGRLCRGIQISIQKSRPYVERDIVAPISATAMDEIHLSTASSALQRIHDSAPSSQHSEPLQWSVWQIAGSSKLRLPPLFDLPSWIYDTGKDQE